jgi:hypothetical protein
VRLASTYLWLSRASVWRYTGLVRTGTVDCIHFRRACLHMFTSPPQVHNQTPRHSQPCACSAVQSPSQSRYLDQPTCSQAKVPTAAQLSKRRAAYIHHPASHSPAPFALHPLPRPPNHTDPAPHHTSARQAHLHHVNLTPQYPSPSHFAPPAGQAREQQVCLARWGCPGWAVMSASWVGEGGWEGYIDIYASYACSLTTSPVPSILLDVTTTTILLLYYCAL